MGLKTTVVLTKMDHPVGKMIGNSLEVIEAVQCLGGKGPKVILELVCVLGATISDLPTVLCNDQCQESTNLQILFERSQIKSKQSVNLVPNSLNIFYRRLYVYGHVAQ
jgi:thymidine phosphorylase